MSLTVVDFPYLPGKRLTCRCERTFKTERGLKQHIRLATETGIKAGFPPVVTGHGRQLGDAGRYIIKTLIRRSNLRLVPNKL